MARLGRSQPNRPVVVRGALEDQTVLKTPSPIILVGSPGRRGVPNAGHVHRSSLQDPATPAPLVVSRPTKRALLVPAVVVRATLDDPPVLTTPAPVVVIGSPGRRGVPTIVTILRASLQDTPVITGSMHPAARTAPAAAVRVAPAAAASAATRSAPTMTGR